VERVIEGFEAAFLPAPLLDIVLDYVFEPPARLARVVKAPMPKSASSER
jgi:hypothetical protein